LPEKGIRSKFSSNEEDGSPDPVELQSQLLRFADNSIQALNLAIGKLQREDDATRRRTLLSRRITTTNDILAIVTGANTYVFWRLKKKFA
jgi:hypothetical protein